MRARDNPFNSERVTGVRFLCETPEDALWKHLEALNWQGAIVGPCGSGKTTLLEATERHLSARGFQVDFYRLNTQTTVLPASLWHQSYGENHALLVDGFEQLKPWHRYRLIRHGRGFRAFIVTSHRPTPLPLWLATSTTPTLLQQVARELGQPLSLEDAQILWQTHRGNIRLALWQLYDEYSLNK